MIGFVGVVVLLRRDIGGGQSTLLGYGAHLIGALFYGVSAVLARRYLQKVPLLVQSLVPIAFADALIWIMVPVVESPLHLPSSSPVWWSLVWSGVLASCLAYIFYYYLLHSIGPTRTSMVTYTFPVVGVTLGVAFLGESLDAFLVLGTALILASLYVVNRA